MAKTKNRPVEEPQTENGKDAEVIASEMAKNGGKYGVIAIIVVIVIGIIAVIQTKKEKANQRQAAQNQQKLDAAILDFSNSGDAKKKEDLEGDLAKLAAVQSELKGSPAAMDAAFFEAKTQFHLGEYKKAAELFTNYYSNNKNRFPLTDLAKYNAASSLMAAGDMKAARDLLEAQEKTLDDKDLKKQFRYQAAICAALQGDKDVAMKYLGELSKDKDDKLKETYIAKTAQRLMSVIKDADPEKLKQLNKSFPSDLKVAEKTANTEPKTEPKKK